MKRISQRQQYHGRSTCLLAQASMYTVPLESETHVADQDCTLPIMGTGTGSTACIE